MRKVLALMLIGGSLAAGVSTAAAMEREQFTGSTRPAATVATTDNVGTTGSAPRAELPQVGHDRQ